MVCELISIGCWINMVVQKCLVVASIHYNCWACHLPEFVLEEANYELYRSWHCLCRLVSQMISTRHRPGVPTKSRLMHMFLSASNHDHEAVCIALRSDVSIIIPICFLVEDGADKIHGHISWCQNIELLYGNHVANQGVVLTNFLNESNLGDIDLKLGKYEESR